MERRLAKAGDDPAAWDLTPAGWARLRTLLGRAVARRCPYCGGTGIFTTWWSLREACPRCGTVFSREDGYFLGAYAVNLIVAEFLGLGLVLVLLFRSDYSLLVKEIIAISAAVSFPVLLFPYSRTFWMAIDLFFDRRTSERRLRGEEMHDGRGERRP